MTETLLINPPYQSAIRSVAQTTVGPPMGLAYLAGAMLAAGEHVHIHDANALNWTIDDTVREAASVNPDAIGLTASTATLSIAASVATGLRHVGFGGPILLGGPHASALPHATLAENPAFTLCVMGEAEDRIAAIMDALRSKAGFAHIPGVAWRRGHTIVVNPAPTTLIDVDAIAPPARHLLPEDRYFCPDGKTAGTVIANRGCPAPCTYCLVPKSFGRKIRRRNVAHVADEVLELVNRGATWINFIDDTFTWDEPWVVDLCAAFHARDLPQRRVRWQCLTRVDRVSPGLFQTMKRAGCARVEMGIECGTQKALKALRKNIPPQDVLRAFRWAREAHLETLAFAMVNVPGETLADIAATRDLILKADPDFLQLSYCTPYPGTRLFDDAIEQGRLRTRDWADYKFLVRPVLDNGVLTEHEVVSAHQKLLREFWLRPRVVARMAKRLATRPEARLTTLKAALQGLRSLAR